MTSCRPLSGNGANIIFIDIARRFFMEPKVSVVIPNYNGIEFNRTCLLAMRRQTRPADKIIVVDNGSTDGSLEEIREQFPEVELICFPENTGFTGAVNAGIKASEGFDFVILLNNDTEADIHLVEELLRAIQVNKNIFSCQAKMLKMDDPWKMDDAGDFYCSFGWAFARGKGKSAELYTKPKALFSCCAGASIYRLSVMEEIGMFDENHFAYLEDTDIGWRARIRGYRNIFAPRAKVLHVGSATTGSQYNDFKVKNTSRNSIYLVYKNMPAWQILLNLPLLVFGFTVKAVYFIKKGFGREYITGIGRGFTLCSQNRDRRVPYDKKNFRNYMRIQMELWLSCIRRLID